MINTMEDLTVRLAQLITADLDLADAYQRIKRFRDAVTAAQAVTVYLMVTEGATVTDAAESLEITRQHAHRLLTQHGLDRSELRRDSDRPPLWNYGALLAAVETIATAHEQATGDAHASDYWRVLRTFALTTTGAAPSVWKHARTWISDIQNMGDQEAARAAVTALDEGIGQLTELPAEQRLSIAQYALVLAGYRAGRRATAEEVAS